MKRITTTFIIILLFSIQLFADDVPTINPTATFITDNGEDQETTFSGSAPLTVRLEANPENVGSWNATYEWRFSLEGEEKPYLTRYDENTEYTFTKAGSHNIVLYATFINGTDTVFYTKEYWDSRDKINVTISESKLEMPNAFSPNGDGINDIYKAKDGYQSIVEFHAYIYNRWGQQLYDWNDPSGGWDGKFKGKDVKQGVYYVLVKAKGADGHVFNIKRDVNLLRGYIESNSQY